MMNRDAACRVFELLFRHYCEHNGSQPFLRFENPFQSLILTILSAQTTDRAVNEVADDLFSAYPAPASLAAADECDIEQIIRRIGLYHAKAKNIRATAGRLINEFDGDVPQTMEELLTLPGVGRKTANIVLNHAFGINEGIAVDTHVKRVAYRIGLTRHTGPVRIERDLMDLYPKSYWGDINYLFIRHGRTVCTARNPKCEECIVHQYCQYYRQIITQRDNQQ